MSVSASTGNMHGERGARAPRLPYLPGLDGLRACAVAAVLLYHAGCTWIPGGFLGVEVFFVISGYLITALLLAEWPARRRIDLKAFWLRRARRLLPAVFVLIVAVLAVAVVWLPGEVAGLRGDALASAGYVTNWYLILGEKSYFETVGRPSLLRHLWSLAVEEQFYLIWPLLFAGMLRFWTRRRTIVAILLGAAASTLLMAALYRPDADPSRVYYGTDTRMAGLLVGAALAFLWKPGRTPGVNQAPARALDQGRALDLLGALAFGVLVWSCAGFDEYQPQLYQGGFALVALATAVLIVAAVDPRARLVPRLLGSAPLRWIGLRSYGIYLWHWPVFMLTRPQLDVALDGWQLLAVRAAATLVLAELSYRCVEMPVRRGVLDRFLQGRRATGGAPRRRPALRWAVAALPLLLLGVMLGVRVVSAEPPPVPEYLAVAEIDVGAPEGPLPAPAASPALATATPAPPATGTTPAMADPPAALATVTAPAAPVPTHGATLPAPATPRAAVSVPTATEPGDEAERRVHAAMATAIAGHVTAVGDSVMLATVVDLQKELGDVEVSAKLGRAVSAGIALLRERRDAHQLGQIVVVHLGNNGPFSAKQFDELMQVLSGVRRVVIVNNKVPRTWEEKNNSVLADGVKRYPNAVLVDWYGVSAGRPDFFWSDGMHLRPEGARVYATLVAAYVNAP